MAGKVTDMDQTIGTSQNVFDCIIKGGTIVDGTGTRGPFPADIGIEGDRIAAVGNLASATSERVVDASGKTVTPGFIDVHVHSELALLGGRDQMAGILQGITTNLLAADGFGWSPLPAERARELWRYTEFAYGEVDLPFNWPTVESYLALFPGRIPANVYPQVPHCAVRLKGMGWNARPATDAELSGMLDAAREWMEAGAGSLSVGLDYQPSACSDLRELVELSKLVASYGGVYASHQRYQILGRKDAWEETIEIHRKSGIPVHISHEKVDPEAAGILDQVDREQIDLSFDFYLYPAGMTHLTMMLPMWVQEGDLGSVLERMADPATRAASIPHLRGKLGGLYNQVIGHTKSGRFAAMTLAQAAAATGKSHEEFVYDLILEEEGIQTYILPWPTTPQETESILRRTVSHPRMMVASDGVYNVRHAHPRGYGCFARVLRKFMREDRSISLQDAIHKMSGAPARRFGLKDRGRIAAGMAADLVVFDPERVADQSTWDRPVLPTTGVDWVMVNGQAVIQAGVPTGRLPGRVLRRGD